VVKRIRYRSAVIHYLFRQSCTLLSPPDYRPPTARLRLSAAISSWYVISVWVVYSNIQIYHRHTSNDMCNWLHFNVSVLKILQIVTLNLLISGKIRQSENYRHMWLWPWSQSDIYLILTNYCYIRSYFHGNYCRLSCKQIKDCGHSKTETISSLPASTMAS